MLAVSGLCCFSGMFLEIRERHSMQALERLYLGLVAWGLSVGNKVNSIKLHNVGTENFLPKKFNCFHRITSILIKIRLKFVERICTYDQLFHELINFRINWLRCRILNSILNSLIHFQIQKFDIELKNSTSNSKIQLRIHRFIFEF